MMPLTMQAHDLAIPILPSRSLEKTLAFYARLGFEGEIVAAEYAIVTHGPVEIHFFAHPGVQPDASFAGCYVRVGAVDAVFDRFRQAGLPGRGIPRMDVLENKPWGMREFAVVDEDGNLMRIGQEINN